VIGRYFERGTEGLYRPVDACGRELLDQAITPSLKLLRIEQFNGLAQ
jgi:hypothetical protein